MALKFDIKKAFDTLEWSFLLTVVKAFCICDKFCGWIISIVQSVHLSINVNGHLVGYFSCKRGVRKWDPLSPLLFCIAEEVLSRGITKLVQEGKIQSTFSLRGFATPSHALYADDIMVFCKGLKRSIRNLMQLFNL